jgi:hypothetical protein
MDPISFILKILLVKLAIGLKSSDIYFTLDKKNLSICVSIWNWKTFFKSIYQLHTDPLSYFCTLSVK